MTSFLKKQKVVVGQFTERMFMRKQPPEGFLRKSVMRHFAEFTRKLLCRNLFFDKVINSVDLQHHKKRVSSTAEIS